MDALLAIFALYVLMVFVGMMPPPTLFFAVWLDNRERRLRRKEDR